MTDGKAPDPPCGASGALPACRRDLTEQFIMLTRLRSLTGCGAGLFEFRMDFGQCHGVGEQFQAQ